MARLTGIMKYDKELGKTVPMTAQEVRQDIMTYMGYTDKRQYEKAYDILRNKLRAYEAVNRVPDEMKQSVIDFFYKYARAQSNPAYKMSDQMREIQSMVSVSSGKALQRYVERERVAEPVILTQAQKVVMDNLIWDYAELYNAAPLVRQMFEDIKNPYALKKALREYTDLLKVSKEGEKHKTGGWSTQSFGYDAIANFNYTAYLDDSKSNDFWL